MFYLGEKMLLILPLIIKTSGNSLTDGQNLSSNLGNKTFVYLKTIINLLNEGS